MPFITIYSKYYMPFITVYILKAQTIIRIDNI